MNKHRVFLHMHAQKKIKFITSIIQSNRFRKRVQKKNNQQKYWKGPEPMQHGIYHKISRNHHRTTLYQQIINSNPVNKSLDQFCEDVNIRNYALVFFGIRLVQDESAPIVVTGLFGADTPLASREQIPLIISRLLPEGSYAGRSTNPAFIACGHATCPSISRCGTKTHPLFRRHCPLVTSFEMNRLRVEQKNSFSF